MTLENARSIQSENQKKSITKFSVCFVAVLIFTFLIYKFCFSEYSALFAMFLVLTFLSAKYSKIHLFFQRKEFIGIVQYSHVNIEQVKKYASHQAGTTYATTEVWTIDLIVVDDNGKSMKKNFSYDWRWGEFDGKKVAVLRFVDRPIICE